VGWIVGVWGRRGGKVDIKVTGPLSEKTRQAVRAEALSLPIPATTVTVDIAEC
jgi:hypothetical protein